MSTPKRTIYLDAEFDLNQVGEFSPVQVAKFERAYVRNAKLEAKARGMEITVSHTSGEQTNHGDKTEIWQAIHDRTPLPQ